LNEDENRATVQVAEDQQSLAIGRGGQNVRLAARLTGWKIDIRSAGGGEVAGSDGAKAQEVQSTDVEDISQKESAFEETEKEMSVGETEAESVVDEKSVDPIAQDRDIASEKVEEQQEEVPTDKEKDAE
jgi:N utilization substance protein A